MTNSMCGGEAANASISARSASQVATITVSAVCATRTVRAPGASRRALARVSVAATTSPGRSLRSVAEMTWTTPEGAFEAAAAGAAVSFWFT